MILLSAGHHPSKPGACYEGFCEHDEAVRWIDEIYSIIGGSDCLRVPVGVLKGKIDFINARQPTLAVEIHFNSFQIWEDLNKNGLVDEGEMINKGSGALSLYYPGSTKGKRLATEIQESMETIYRRHWKGVMEGWYRMNPKFGPDYFLERTKCPSVIIEPEFIHRRERIENGRGRAYTAIAEALLKIQSEWSNG